MSYVILLWQAYIAFPLPTFQAALLLKSQVDAIHEGDLIDLSSDTDIAELIGQSISLDRYVQ